jgi:hypothetical protein
VGAGGSHRLLLSMVIKASAAAEIRLLVDALNSTDDVQREAAVARLAVIGPRAIERLTDA